MCACPVSADLMAKGTAPSLTSLPSMIISQKCGSYGRVIIVTQRIGTIFMPK